MGISEVILEQLGGKRFLAMTGTRGLLADGNTLRMTLAKNESRANRLYITLDANDTYTMRFFCYTADKLNKETMAWADEIIDEVAEYKNVFADDLRRIFSLATGLDTRLFEND